MGNCQYLDHNIHSVNEYYWVSSTWCALGNITLKRTDVFPIIKVEHGNNGWRKFTIVMNATKRKKWIQRKLWPQGSTPTPKKKKKKKKQLLSRINLIFKKSKLSIHFLQLNWTVYLWYTCQVKTCIFTSCWSQVLLKNHFIERKEII